MAERNYHKKLVRDNIPQAIKEKGEECEYRIMDEDEYITALRKKLLEEAQEASSATPDELLGELADVLQVIKDLGAMNGITFEQIENSRASKEERLGGFNDKIFLEWSSKPKGEGVK